MTNQITTTTTTSKSALIRDMHKKNPTMSQYKIAKTLNIRPQFVSNVLKNERAKIAKQASK